MEAIKIILLLIVFLLTGCNKQPKPLHIKECQPLQEINVTVEYNGHFIISDEDFSKILTTLSDRKYKYQECSNRIIKYNKLIKNK